MHKLSIAASCLAALIIMAGCAANQGSGLVPPSPALTSAGPMAAADLGRRDGPDSGSSIVEFIFAASKFAFITPDFAGHEWLGAISKDAGAPALLSIDEHTGSSIFYDLSQSYSTPYGLAMNPAHDVLWFTEPDTNAIGYMNLLNQTTGQFTVPTHHSKPEGITAGPDNAMWFAEAASGKIGRIDTTAQTFTEYNVPAPSKPLRITLGPDGALWFTNKNSIGRITTKGHIHIYSIGQNKPTGITTGPDGGIWFTGESDHNGSMLGRIDPSTHVRKIYKYSAGDGGNEDLAVRDSDFWMTRTQGNRIDRFDHTTHIIHSRPLPQGYTHPFGIALGADNQLWFVNDWPGDDAIGKFCPSLAKSQCKGAL